MDQRELKELLDRLIAEWESEVVEFKNVGDSYSTPDIGKYFSALANEANLRGLDRAWLVFGVDNRTRRVVGSAYREEPERLNALKHSVSQGAEPSVTMRDIHVLEHESGRVVMFEIPAAPQGMPVAWNGYYYGRDGESLRALAIDKQDEIRRQTAELDWTGQVVPEAGLDDLDPAAVDHAREAFIARHVHRFRPEEVHGWPDAVFLDRARLTFKGRITRAVLLLLGTPESAGHLSPCPAQLTWSLRGETPAYQHFGPPFVLATTALYRSIRNVQIRILPDDALLPVEVAKYDRSVVLEALHNCIAHQDYSRNSRVVVHEHPDCLTFENAGDFFEGTPGDYVTGERTPLRYRNPFLAQAMASLNMIDTMGYGISRMFRGQAERYFPLPDYDLSDSTLVRMTIHGRVLDPAYSRMLIERTELPLEDVLALDRVQKRAPIDSATAQRLRRAGLIEGRKPNLHVSASVARASATEADYIRTRPLDDEHYKRMVLAYIRLRGSASRKDIDGLLLDKLSDALSDSRKQSKIGNLLTAMRRAGTIRNAAASRKASRWVIAEETQNRTGDNAD